MKDVAGNETQGEKHTLRLFVHIRGMDNHICRLFSSLAEVDVGRGDSFFFIFNPVISSLDRHLDLI